MNHPIPDNPKATIVADLTRAENLPSDVFDCIVLTQVLPFIPDVQGAVRTLHRILTRLGRDYWRFTSLSARHAFESGFPEGDLRVEAHGNVLVATAFLYGLSTRDLRPQELDFHDPTTRSSSPCEQSRLEPTPRMADDNARRIPAS